MANPALPSRASFEELSLVAVEQRGHVKWYRPSECLWSSNINIDGKVYINDQYSEFKVLSTEVLGVRHINMAMVYDSLLVATSDGASVERIKELLLELNSLLITESKPRDPERLLRSLILPVRCPGDNSPSLYSREMAFVVVDQEDIFQAFRDRITYLDFSLHEACRLRPFIYWAGLETKYLSRCVEAVSKVQGGVEFPIRDPNRDVKRKAYGLLR